VHVLRVFPEPLPSKGGGKSTLVGRVNFPLARRFARTIVGYGVIGSPADSGSVSLGSSPGTPAQYEVKTEYGKGWLPVTD
jgi:hypothetical protein